jgi:hypothetical protein
VATVVCAGIALAGTVSSVVGQTDPNCPYGNGISTPPGCVSNSNPDPIPPNLGGSRMRQTSCASALPYAMASLYSYDDPSCHPGNSNLPAAGPGLKFVDDAINYLPSFYKQSGGREFSRNVLLRYCVECLGVGIQRDLWNLRPS